MLDKRCTIVHNASIPTRFSIGVAMKSNYDLPLAFGVAKTAEWLDDEEIASCPSYRCAVRLCWAHRRSQGMTQRTLAEYAGLYPSHVSDYLSSDAVGKRTLPADKVAAFEQVCGNRAITQWEMKQRGLTILEEVIARKAA